MQIPSRAVALVVLFTAACPLRPKTSASQASKPAESGYADVNGLKMYYEVYGEPSASRRAAAIRFQIS